MEEILRTNPQNPPYQQAFDHMIGYLRELNPNYADLIVADHQTMDSIISLVNETIASHTILIQFMPFTTGITPEKITDLCKKYNIQKGTVQFGVKQRDGTWKMVESKKPVLIGDQYFFLLYKMPHLRVSGMSYINQYRTPIRPSSNTKLQFPFAQTPIKLGEDEIRNFIMTGGPELAARILGMYANSTPAVNKLAEYLLFAKDPAKLDAIDMSTEEIVQTNSIVGVAQHIFSCLGVEISTNTAKLDVNAFGDLSLPTDVNDKK